MNCPKTDDETDCSRPLPPQAGQLSRLVPGAAPVASQVEHGTATGKGTERCTPRAACSSSISTSASTSAPRERREPKPPPPKRSSPNKAEKRSVMLPKSKSLGRNPPVRSPSCPYLS